MWATSYDCVLCLSLQKPDLRISGCKSHALSVLGAPAGAVQEFVMFVTSMDPDEENMDAEKMLKQSC